jgi:hypothetical protein
MAQTKATIYQEGTKCESGSAIGHDLGFTSKGKTDSVPSYSRRSQRK